MGRHVRARRGIVALIALALFAPGIASPSARGTTGDEQRLARARDLAPHDALRIKAGDDRPQRPAVRPADVLLSKGDPRSPATIAAAARALTERTWDVELPDPRERLEALSKARGGDVEETDWTLRYGLPGGDLTGDGLDDAVSLDFDLTTFTASELHGIRGTDGDVLWSLPLGAPYDAWVVPTGDVTGDGAGDLLLSRLDVEFTGVGGCTPAVFVCALSDGALITWSYSLVSGADGAIEWTRQFDGRYTASLVFASALLALGYVEQIEATNILVLAELGGDHDGDGVRDIVFNRFDLSGVFALAYAFAVVADAYAEVPLFNVNTTAEIASGEDGDTFFSRNDGPSQGGNLLHTVGDTVGDPTVDLGWDTYDYNVSPYACAYVVIDGYCLGTTDAALGFEMIDGDSLATAWTEQLDDDEAYYTFVDAAGGDLDGDGKDDLLVEDWWEFEVSAVGGATGGELWRRAETLYPSVLGSVGGSPGDDVLAIEATYSFDEETFEEIITLHLIRLDGADGSFLFQSDHAFSSADGWWDIVLFPSGDNDGDGVGDVALDALLIDNDTYEVASSHLVIESGASPDPIFNRDVDGLVVGLPTGDLDADGADDLLDVGITFEDDATSLRFEAYRLPSGLLAWTRTDTFQGWWDLLLITTGDQRGDGGDDTIYDRLQEGPGTFVSRVDGIDGRTGSFTWGFGPAFPGVVPRAVVSGTVTDEDDAPISDVCVDAFDAETGEPLQFSFTRPDGTYRLVGLSEGEVKIRFEDCNEGYFQGEWYDDQAEFDAADNVSVLAGEETAGIDAQLTRIGEPPPPAEPPLNDNFADAETVEVRPASLVADTRGATVEETEPSGCGVSGATAWYRLGSAYAGPVTMNTVGSDYDTVLSVYRGDSVEALEEIACNDDMGFGSLQSAVTVVLEPGQSYYVQAGGFLGDGGFLQLTLS